VGKDDVLAGLKKGAPLFWTNPEQLPVGSVLPGLPLQYEDILAAADRLARFAPLLADLFPELEASRGVIESDLRTIPAMEDWMNQQAAGRLKGRVMIKADHDLPVAGSVKARGGIHEVLLFAEELALEKRLLVPGDDLRTLGRPQVRDFFRRYTVSVGSTGNLGLSIGITAAALGFKAVVHMSREAKQWKKERLRSRGVTVIEHAADYSAAVAAGREAARSEPNTYFVDDEASRALFSGYSVAGLRLKSQLAQGGIRVDRDHPLLVYLPCGVGGAPGGITFGLKHVFGDDVHCFFAEPVQAPCMLLGLLSGFSPPTAVGAVGLDLKTAADGLAVGSASALVGQMIKNLVSGVYTIDDDPLFRFLHALYLTENIRIEPSAAAGFAGPFFVCQSIAGESWLGANRMTGRLSRATHIIWTTGGSLLPPAEFSALVARGSRAAPAFPDSIAGRR
jgi:D-serine dehydratase